MPPEPLFLPHSQVDDSPPLKSPPYVPLSQDEEEAPSSMAPPYQKQSYASQSQSPPPSQPQQESESQSQSQAPQSQPLAADSQTQPIRRNGKRKHIFETVEEDDQQSVSKPLNSAEKEDSCAGDKSIVGVLLGEVNGIGKIRIVIRLDKIILIGRSPANDVTLDFPAVSRRHLRLTPVRTSSQLTTVAVTDMSSSGFYLNDVYHRPSRLVQVHTKKYRCMTYILNERDKIRLPGCPTVFTFYQGPAHQNKREEGFQLFETAQQPRYLIGNYWVVHNFQLGDGSFGVVNLASHRTAAWFQVACKTVKLEDDDDTVRHKNEVNLLKRMNHPNVNGIIDLFKEEDPKRSHMILELMAGGDLFAYQEKHGALGEMEVRWIGWQLVQGLEYLHKMNIAHRDLKPENVLLAVSCMYPRVVICDFGHSIDYQGMLEKTPKNEYEEAKRHIPQIGTASYIPPERLKMWLRPPPKLRGWGEDLPAIRGVDGKKGMSRRERLAYMWFAEEKNIDSWSLGVTLFITATQSHPYESTTGSQQQLASTTSGRKLTSAQSWASFRQGTGMGSSVGRSFIDPEESAKLKNLLDGCRLMPFLFSGSQFNDWSEEGKKFLRALMETSVTKRLQISQASKHEWFTSQQKVLDALWKKVVEEGSVLHPDTAAELFAACSEKEAEIPPSQASRGPSPEAAEDIFSVHTQTVDVPLRPRKRRASDSIEEIEEPGETHLEESREEIEVDETENMSVNMDESYSF